MELARTYAKIDDNAGIEDELIEVMLAAAREACEDETGLSFAPKTYRLTISYADFLEKRKFPHGPNIVITSVLDADGAEVTEFMFHGTTWYAEYLKGMSVNNTWTEDFCGFGAWGYRNPYLEQNYTVTYTAGYAAGKLPARAKNAILATFFDLYQNRGNTIIGAQVQELPKAAKELLAPMREKVLF